MARPVIESSSLPETVCGKDERVRVDPTTSPPYKWICYLSIESANGSIYSGSGFKIHLPEVNSTARSAVVTSGHCTFVEGAYATRITVAFPGQTPFDVRSKDLYASPEYIASGSADHDYGLIILPAGQVQDGFGWSTLLEDSELQNRLVTNCGYPGDKPRATMWVTGGEIESFSSNRIFYMNDTAGGQSGSPVYTWYGGYWTVLAVHSYGGCPNSAPRFTREMIFRFLQRMDGLKLKSLRSVAFPDVYVRCDGTGVTQLTDSGAGTVNCQYKPPTAYEKFYIYPLQVSPSSALTPVYKVVVESAQFPLVFIRMESKGMSAFNGPGGGVVNCQYTADIYETYFLRKENGNAIYSFRNVHFKHCYIRLDGRGVNSSQGSGSGTVNCQWYADPSSPAQSYETFYIEEH